MITTEHNQQLEPLTIDAATMVGLVTVGVRDLDNMVKYYQQVIGLTMLDRTATAADLGVAETTLIRLETRPNGRAYPQATGLFHLALLLPTRQDLGHWLKHFITSQQRMIDGAGDHLVSEALYLSDPEGNGLEIYWDRPREMWEYNGKEIKMATLAVDLPAVVAEAPDAPFEGLPQKTTLGHVHLQVDDVDKAVGFYRDIVGFDLMTTYPGAGFLGAGGYHHHLGVNVWNSKGASPPPSDSLGLISYTIVLPNEPVRETLLARLDRLNYPIHRSGAEPLVTDPAGNNLVLVVG